MPPKSKVEKSKTLEDAEKTVQFTKADGTAQEPATKTAITANTFNFKAADGKVPGWMKDNKALYSDKYLQDLVKQTEVPGVGGEHGAKCQGADEVSAKRRPQHKAKIQFKPSEALQKEAAKVNELLEKVVVKLSEDLGKSSPSSKQAAPAAEEPSEAKGKDTAKITKEKTKGKGKKTKA